MKIQSIALIALSLLSLNLIGMKPEPKNDSTDWKINIDNEWMLASTAEKPYWQNHNDQIKSTKTVIPFHYPLPEVIKHMPAHQNLMEKQAFKAACQKILQDELAYRKSLSMPREHLDNYAKIIHRRIKEDLSRLSTIHLDNKQSLIK